VEEVELKGRRGGVEAELVEVQPMIDQVGVGSSRTVPDLHSSQPSIFSLSKLPACPSCLRVHGAGQEGRRVAELKGAVLIARLHHMCL